jgi:hypothetical protein
MEKGRLVSKRHRSRCLSLAQVAAAASVSGEPLEVESYHEATETPAEGVFTALRGRGVR